MFENSQQQRLQEKIRGLQESKATARKISRYRHFSLAAKIMPAIGTAIVAAVPRSGCRQVIPAGIAASITVSSSHSG